jgi:hypothetical protein
MAGDATWQALPGRTGRRLADLSGKAHTILRHEPTTDLLNILLRVRRRLGGMRFGQRHPVGRLAASIPFLEARQNRGEVDHFLRLGRGERLLRTRASPDMVSSDADAVLRTYRGPGRSIRCRRLERP